MPSVLSKKQIAGQLYADMSKTQSSRKDIIAAMVKYASLSFSGASTYFSNFKSGQWKLNATPIKLVERPDYSKLSDSQLLDYYNQHADVKLHGFASRDDAIVMIEKYIVNI